MPVQVRTEQGMLEAHAFGVVCGLVRTASTRPFGSESYHNVIFEASGLTTYLLPPKRRPEPRPDRCRGQARANGFSGSDAAYAAAEEKGLNKALAVCNQR